MQRRREILRLIERHQRRLAKLQESAALSGNHTPPDVQLEIEDIEREIEQLRAQLQTETEKDAAVSRSFSQLETGPMGEILLSIREQISRLEVSDPRLEMLKRQLFDLSIMTDQLQERVARLENNERIGLTIARAVAIAAFVVLVVLVSRFI